MLKIRVFHFLIISTFLLYSCSNKSAENKKIKPSKQMKGFMDSLDGTYQGVTNGLTRYAEKEVMDDDITRLDLKSPKLILFEKLNANQECYTMEANIGITTKTFIICWENSKIYSIVDQGFKE